MEIERKQEVFPAEKLRSRASVLKVKDLRIVKQHQLRAILAFKHSSSYESILREGKVDLSLSFISEAQSWNA